MKHCVIGKSLPHTMSPNLHRLLGDDRYSVVELPDNSALRDFVSSKGYGGYNVTIPYKREIVKYLDFIEEEAKEIGAVNTVAEINGKLCGFNTDIGGMRKALTNAGIELYDRSVMILGGGGTSMTAAYCARKAGAREIIVVSRSGEVNYENCYEYREADVIINTTPVGMYPNAWETPISLHKFERLSGVFDAVYNPLKTRLVYEAEGLKISAANGLAMLVEQGRLSHNIFACAENAEPLAESVTDKVCLELVKGIRNITLIGMAGCGKSAVGRALAKKLGREFVDTDEEIEKSEGRSILQVFAECGEEYFRALESEIVQRECLKTGRVMATGGGAVLSSKNRFFIGCNGIAVLILRDADKLDTSGRPLSSTRESAARLFKERKEIYYSTADFWVTNDKGVDDAVGEIIKRL